MNRQWFTLVVALGMPLVLIGAVAGSMKLSEGRIAPTYDILYSVGDTYGRPYFYVNGTTLQSDSVNENGQIIMQPSTTTQNNYEYESLVANVRDTRFYRYDPVKDTSTPVGGYAEARALYILSIDRSPDGYRVMRGDSGGGGMVFPFVFDVNYGDSFVMEGNKGKKRIELLSDTYSTNIIGWIAK